MTQGFTGGQYSILRAIAGVLMLVVLVVSLPGTTGIGQVVVVAGALASILFAIGWLDRIAAIVLWAFLAFTIGLDQGFADPLVLFAATLFLIHALLPPAPFGSLAARGRVDPRGGWHMPRGLFVFGWVAICLGYAWAGYSILMISARMTTLSWIVMVIALAYAPLALVRPLRPWLWCAMLLTQIAILATGESAALAVIACHVLTFVPAWIPRRAAESVDIVFYDGSCGLCHRSVRMLIAEDPDGSSFAFAPIGSERFQASFPPGLPMPDSIVVLKPDGSVLTRSDAIVHLQHRMGGVWRILGFLLGGVPRGLRDAWYDFVARIRYRIFGRTKDACPLLPPDLRSRFS